MRNIYFLCNSLKVGITAFADLFKVSPDLRQTFSFFEYYKIDDEKFYILVTKHALRILGMVSQLVKQVVIVLILTTLSVELLRSLPIKS